MLTTFLYKCKSCSAPLEIKNIFGLFSCSHCGTNQRFSDSNLISDPVIMGGEILGGEFDLIDNLRTMRASYSRKSYEFSRSYAIDIIRHFPNELEAIYCAILSDFQLNHAGRGARFYSKLAIEIYSATINDPDNLRFKFMEELLRLTISFSDNGIDSVMPNCLIILESLSIEDRFKVLQFWAKDPSYYHNNKSWPYGRKEEGDYRTDDRMMNKICNLYGNSVFTPTLYSDQNSGKRHWIRKSGISEKQMSYLHILKKLAVECGWAWEGDQITNKTFHFYIYDSPIEAPKAPVDDSNLWGAGCLLILGLVLFFPIRSCMARQDRQERIALLTGSNHGFIGEISHAHYDAMRTWEKWNDLRNHPPGQMWVGYDDLNYDFNNLRKMRDRAAESRALIAWKQQVNDLQQSFESQKARHANLVAELAELQRK
jgi:hypothetical protein